MGQCLFRKGTAVVIGNEGNGLPEEVSAACDRRVTIPMHGTIESLNAAMAAGIIPANLLYLFTICLSAALVHFLFYLLEKHFTADAKS